MTSHRMDPKLTQCTHIATDKAFARILSANNSGKINAGTGPAPSANINTYLQTKDVTV